MNREIIIETSASNLDVIHRLIQHGVKDFVLDEDLRLGTGFSVMIHRDDNLYLNGKLAGKYLHVKRKEDLDLLNRYDGTVVVELEDIKALAAENIVAVYGSDRILPLANSTEEFVLYSGILEKGFRSIVLRVDRWSDDLEKLLVPDNNLALAECDVTEVRWIGMGERACIDFATALKEGDGCLIGSFSNFLFLVGAEIYENSFAPSRPFRVNAGAVHSYCMGSSNRSFYLSELKSGDSVAVVTVNGTMRNEIVGRVKKEIRPLILIKASCNGMSGSVILQNAESIYLLSTKGPIFVNRISAGDHLLAYCSNNSRHMGIPVDERVVEV